MQNLASAEDQLLIPVELLLIYLILTVLTQTSAQSLTTFSLVITLKWTSYEFDAGQEQFIVKVTCLELDSL